MKHIKIFEDYNPEELSGIDIMIMIDDISKMIEEHWDGEVTSYDLTLDASVVYKEDETDIHLIDRFYTDNAEVVQYGGYKQQDEIDTYPVRYEDLDNGTLFEIYDILKVGLNQ